MMNKGYVIPAKAGIQSLIFEILTFKVNLSKPDKQVMNIIVLNAKNRIAVHIAIAFLPLSSKKEQRHLAF
jgi:hypothetical protein